MGTDHRGRPTGNNHRSYPRVAAMIQRELLHGGSNTNSSGSDIVKAHQTGAPISLDDNPAGAVSGPVYTNMPSKVNSKLERELVQYAGARDGLGDAMQASIDRQNEFHDINAAVAGYGGPSQLIDEAFANRHKNRERADKRLNQDEEYL